MHGLDERTDAHTTRNQYAINFFEVGGIITSNEPLHDKISLMAYANKGADKPVHPHSLISTFVFRCIDSIIHTLAILKIPRLQLVSVAEQAGLSCTWS